MNTKKQFITFIFVGILNTLFGYALYAFFVFIGMTYPIALLTATCLGVLFNFLTIGRFVFDKFDARYFLKFISLYAVLFCLNLQAISYLEQLLHNLYAAGFIAAMPIAMLSFIMNKFVVFRKSYETN
jgi:putative flippase GtrA